MDSSDLNVMRAAANWLAQGARVHLVTVIRTWGSSPRPAGSLLAVGGSGQLAGSVSGGCVEDDLVAKLRAGHTAATAPEIITYGLTREEGERFGLPCGGVLELACEPLDARSGVADIVATLERREAVARDLDLGSGAAQLRPAQPEEAPCARSGDTFTKVFGPQWQLIIVGAAELSRCIAQLALALDYHVVVVDPRPDYATAWDLPGTELVTTSPDDVVRVRVTDARSAVITLTHDPRVDDLALMEALESPAFYVGALGSERTTQARRERLRQLDLPEAAIARLRAPVGLPIGSHAPMEIAVAIAGELIAVRNQVLADARGALADTATRKARAAA